MKITPLEIRQKDFEKKLRGYDKDEVNAFLQSLSNEWERMLEENKDLNLKLQQADREVKKLREVESSLYKTLKTAEETGANVVEQANKAAELHMKETQMNAEALLNESKNKARAMIEQAEVEARQIIEELQEAVKSLEQNHRDIENQRDMALQELKNLSVALIEKVERNAQEPKEFRFDDYVKRVKKLAKESDQRIKAEKTTVEVKSKIVEEAAAPAEEKIKKPEQAEKTEEVVQVEDKKPEADQGKEELLIPSTDDLKKRMVKRQELRVEKKKEEPEVKVEEEKFEAVNQEPPVKAIEVAVQDPISESTAVEEEVPVAAEEAPLEEKKGPRIARTVSFFDELDTDN